MESDVQTQIDLAYRNMMAARTETAERYWCDRLKHFIEQRKRETA